MKTKKERKPKAKNSISNETDQIYPQTTLEPCNPIHINKGRRADTYFDEKDELGIPDEDIICIRKLPNNKPHPRPPFLTTFDEPKDIDLNDDDLIPQLPNNINPDTYKEEEILNDQNQLKKLTSYLEAAKKGQDSNRRIEKSLFGLTKPPPEGKIITYIFSFEMLNTILANGKGRPLSEERKNEIRIAMNSKVNIKMKADNGSDGYSSDMQADAAIMNAINSRNPDEKILTNKKFAARLLNVWDVVQKLDLPSELKQQIEKQLSQIKDKNGDDIIK